jgi:hypothetical protein
MTPWAALALTILTAGRGPQSVDQTLDLAVSERVIEGAPFEAAQALSVEQSGLSMHIGVRLAAGTIRVLLRNVHGHVRFRADFGPIVNVLHGRASPPPAGAAGGGKP